MDTGTLKETTIQKYNEDRQTPNPENICNAPKLNIYFNSWGRAGACWLTLENAPSYPEQSIRQIWFGKFFETLRNDIKSNNLKNGCAVCKKRIEDNVFPQVLARAYDIKHAVSEFPQIMEFELSNLCNLGCIMCKGTLSSKIRKDRENLAPFKSPYDDNFVEQLKEFLPHLKEARFNGGEPFLQQICWKIWEAIADINPNIEITVATNGTLLTDKMKSVMERCRFRVNVSLDSLIPERYESIRVGSNFDLVIKNLIWYRQYCKKVKTILTVMVNPMRNNWEEMPEFVKWCTQNGYCVWFNTIWRPRHLAIWTLPSMEISRIRDFYKNYDFSMLEQGVDPNLRDSNYRAFQSFAVHQIDGWLNDQINREANRVDYQLFVSEMKGSKERFISRQSFLEAPQFFEELEVRTAKVFSKEVLYFYLNKESDYVLNSKRLDPDQNAVLEWVYQICDYY